MNYFQIKSKQYKMKSSNSYKLLNKTKVIDLTINTFKNDWTSCKILIKKLNNAQELLCNYNK